MVRAISNQKNRGHTLWIVSNLKVCILTARTALFLNKNVVFHI